MQKVVNDSLGRTTTGVLAALLAVLCQRLPAAQQLPASCVVDMIYKVIKHPYGCCSSCWKLGLDTMLRDLVALPAAQEIPRETAEDILCHCLLQQMPCLFVQEPMQQLDVGSVRRLPYEAVDWYR
jgi:hypothetical protein